MKKSKKEFRHVVIEEYYSKEKKEIFWNWRLVTTHPSKWNKVLTFYTDIPIVEIKL